MSSGRGARAWLGVLLVVGALVAGTAAGTATVGAAAGPTVDEAIPPEGSVANETDDRIYVWSSDFDSLTVRVEPGGESARVRLCVEAADPSDRTTGRISCRDQRVFERNGTVGVPLGGWATDRRGPQRLSVVLRDPDTDAVLDRYRLPVVLVSRGGDLDADGLTDGQEFENGTDVELQDTDQDGLLDGTEVGEYGTDPLSNDTDADGLRDAREINGGTNATDPDTDGDGLTDGAEVTEYGTDPLVADTDGDGLADGAEVTRYGTDPTEADTDGDLLDDPVEVSLGVGATNWLTTPAVLVGIVAALGAFGIVRGRGVTVPAVGGGGEDEEKGGVADGTGGGAERFGGDTDGGPENDAGGERRDGEDPASGDAATPSSDPAPLTDADRVRQLLRESGGRLQQGAVVERTEWSKSKVSRLLSRMEEDGEIEKITIGRENLIALREGTRKGVDEPSEE